MTARTLNDPAPPTPTVIAQSVAMQKVVETARRVAQSDVPVLLLGESGTGKEVLAQTLHDSSRRSGRPLVRYNCAALPAGLAEAELFGHSKGAFTGAHEDRRGIFAEADGGTLLLDEVAELPLEVQGKFLRILQTGEMQMLGKRRTGAPPERVDARIVCATNRNIVEAVEQGVFRADLLYRLSVVVLRLPPLRERLDDIAPLATHFAAVYGARYGLGAVHLTDPLVERLREQPWPGNVRELENAIARMVVLGMGSVLDLSDWERALSTSLRGEQSSLRSGPVEIVGPLPGSASFFATGPGAVSPAAAGSANSDRSLREQVERIEAEILAETLARFGGNQSKAALSLNISRVTLAAKIRKYNLTLPTSEPAEAPSARTGSGPHPMDSPRRSGPHGIVDSDAPSGPILSSSSPAEPLQPLPRANAERKRK